MKNYLTWAGIGIVILLMFSVITMPTDNKLTGMAIANQDTGININPVKAFAKYDSQKNALELYSDAENKNLITTISDPAKILSSISGTVAYDSSNALLVTGVNYDSSGNLLGATNVYQQNANSIFQRNSQVQDGKITVSYPTISTKVTNNVIVMTSYDSNGVASKVTYDTGVGTPKTIDYRLSDSIVVVKPESGNSYLALSGDNKMKLNVLDNGNTISGSRLDDKKEIYYYQTLNSDGNILTFDNGAVTLINSKTKQPIDGFNTGNNILGIGKMKPIDEKDLSKGFRDINNVANTIMIQNGVITRTEGNIKKTILKEGSGVLKEILVDGKYQLNSIDYGNGVVGTFTVVDGKTYEIITNAGGMKSQMRVLDNTNFKLGEVPKSTTYTFGPDGKVYQTNAANIQYKRDDFGNIVLDKDLNPVTCTYVNGKCEPITLGVATNLPDVVKKQAGWYQAQRSTQLALEINNNLYGSLSGIIQKYNKKPWTYNEEWKSKVDAFFESQWWAGKAGFTSSICGKWARSEDAPSTIAFGRSGLPAAHIEGSRSPGAEETNSTTELGTTTGYKNIWWYKITFGLDTTNMLANSADIVEIRLWVKDSSGNKYKLRLNQSDNSTNSNLLRLNGGYGEYKVIGDKMIVRPSSSDYSQVCLDFSSSLSKLESTFRSNINSDGMLCNSITSEISPDFGIFKASEGTSLATSSESSSETTDTTIATPTNTGEVSSGDGL